MGPPDEEVRERRYLGRDGGYVATEGREDSMMYGGDKRIGIVFWGKLSMKGETRDESDELSGCRGKPAYSLNVLCSH